MGEGRKEEKELIDGPKDEDRKLRALTAKGNRDSFSLVGSTFSSPPLLGMSQGRWAR